MKFVLIYISLFFFFCPQAEAQSTVPDSLNVLDAEGRKQGTWRENYKTGYLKREIIYKDGRKNGLDLQFYHLPNCIKEESQYKNDSLIQRVEYYRNCNIKQVQYFKNGSLDGYTRTYDREGNLATEGFFKDGKLQGTVKKYKKPDAIDFAEKNEPAPKISLEKFLTDDVTVRDSTVLKSLNRIPLTQNTIVVADVTGSMHQNIGQLLLWYNQHMKSTPVSKFVFFNDGDGKHDSKKKIGKTGGIYTIVPDDIYMLKSTMELAITKGNGGDIAENNIEAMLAGVSKFKKVDQIVLIADRRAPVKDISLLKKVKVPVHIVLCGPEEYTHVNYLQIAYATGGSIYSLNQELKDIQGIQEGETLQIANLTFAFKGGQFRRVRN